MSQQAGAAAAKVVKDSSSTVTIIIVLVLLLVAGIGFFAYTRYSQIEFIEKKKLGTKKAKRTAEEERKKAPRNIQ